MQPYGDGLKERTDPRRRVREVCLQKTIEFKQGLFVEANEVEILRLKTCMSQAEVDRVCGKRRIVLFPSKPFLLRSRDDLTVNHQSGCRIVVERRDAQDRCQMSFAAIEKSKRAPPTVGTKILGSGHRTLSGRFSRTACRRLASNISESHRGHD